MVRVTGNSSGFRFRVPRGEKIDNNTRNTDTQYHSCSWQYKHYKVTESERAVRREPGESAPKSAQYQCDPLQPLVSHATPQVNRSS